MKVRDDLLDAEALALSQPALFSMEEIPSSVVAQMETREQSRRDWTAQRLLERNPQLYRVIVRMLAARSFSVRAIAELCEVTEKTVVAVRENSPQSVTAFREVFGARRRNAMARGLDVIEAGLEGGTNKSVQMARDAAVIVGILDQHDRLDGGAPTSIVRVETPAAEGYADFMKAIVGHVVDTGAEVTVLPAKGSGSGESVSPHNP